MAWIKVIEESEAVGYLKDLYRKYLEPAGVVDNIMLIHSLNPKSMNTPLRALRSHDARSVPTSAGSRGK